MSADAKNLLVELLVEELPPKALRAIGDAFANGLHESLRAQGLVGSSSTFNGYASPRRLAVHITGVLSAAPDSEIVSKLMAKSVALDAAGQPTNAFRKRLEKEGRAHLADRWPDAVEGSDRLFIQSDGKADAVYLRSMARGTALVSGLQNALEDVLGKLPIPKVMTYQLADGWSTVNFVRPAHGLIALYGNEVVPVSILGLQADRTTQGHRFEASKSPIEVKHADDYASQLATEGAVIASFTNRKAEIAQQLRTAAQRQGLTLIADIALLDEVTALVEQPNVLQCQFEPEFLEVPQECLILTMKANQKYFPLLDGAGKLTNQFLVVSNVRPADPSRVIEGNERVVRPRLADAKFFFDQDRKKPLISRLEALSKVVYHNKLGSQFDRVQRLKALVPKVLAQLSATTATAEHAAEEAALLCKCDLLSLMVGEFPELQGIMGRYYALADGKPSEVAAAIREHYLPRAAGDELPTATTGMALALADKLDTIAGVFAIDQRPTGARDPFGVRRAAIGILRIAVERELSINLAQLIDAALQLQPMPSNGKVAAEIYDYVMERLRAYYLEGGARLTVTTEMFDAVLANRPVSPLDFDVRLRALQGFLHLNDAQSLAAANKRISNILKKTEITQEAVKADLLKEIAERDLYEHLQRTENETRPLFAQGNYQDALTRLAGLRPTVDKFFDDVMVMTEDTALRNNRLALLGRLRAVFLQAADLSRLPG